MENSHGVSQPVNILLVFINSVDTLDHICQEHNSTREDV